ncbi:helix-hairpin-helix domain-containing protein [Planococcus sp. ISL-109]|uniref:helix-hairpin-helix domain-containing protein n=1 Tax=Planococcus sp. ISL-109 TaxID=2819166 RepID=UPI0020354499|nr:helix-hairpin-helix domain-containing protein [Planococcus sp. ISL-109]
MALLYFFLLREPPQPTSLNDLASAQSQLDEQPPQNPVEETPIATTVMIDVKGAVKSAGLYELPLGARVADAIEAAGGFLPDADSRSINLAVIVLDESSVYVPKAGEETAPVPTTASGGDAQPLVDLNTATEAELTELPGIGPAKAAAIIAHRTDNGPFRSIEQLTDVTGIGDKSFEQLKDLIRVR